MVDGGEVGRSHSTGSQGPLHAFSSFAFLTQRVAVHLLLNSGTVLEAKDYAVSGSGAASIVGYLDLNYPAAEEEGKGGRRHKGLSRTVCEEMVQCALALAVGRDSHSGAICLVGDEKWGLGLCLSPALSHRPSFVSILFISTRHAHSLKLAQAAP